MDQYNTRIRPQPSEVLPEYQPRVVVKFRDGEEPFADAEMAAAPGNPSLRAPGQMHQLREHFPEIVVERLFSSTPPEEVQETVRAARSMEPAAEMSGDEHRAWEIPDLEKFYSVQVPAGVDPREVIAAAEALPGVEEAYLQSPPAPPPVAPGDDVRFINQRYLKPAPEGIDARFAWTLPGGDGSGVDFVDLEQGWGLSHEDLVGAAIGRISGINSGLFTGHGTAVLGIVLAQDNDRGGVGIVPRARGRVVSQHRGPGLTNFNTADAIISATAAMRAGDILLLEAQTRIGNSDYLPVEVEPAVRAAIAVATRKGIIVVEAAGNGGTDLDTFRHPTHGFVLRRGSADFRESGAIMVGAATSAHPHARDTREPFPSNFGSRVDCYAWGENIDTSGGVGTGTAAYTTGFGRTSGASAIVAGAAAALQGIVKARGGQPWTPEHMRNVLSNSGINTPSANPATDRIGVMPDLRAIAAAESLALASAPDGGSPGRRGARRPPRADDRAVA